MALLCGAIRLCKREGLTKGSLGVRRVEIRVTPMLTHTNRGESSIQPSYYTSSLFNFPLREDILKLSQAYTEHYSPQSEQSPFLLFKKLWVSQGWNWLHFRILDVRARKTFFSVICRLFLGIFIDIYYTRN